MRVLIGAVIVAWTASFAAAQFVDYTPAAKPRLGTKVGLTQAEFDALKQGLEKNAVAEAEARPPDDTVPYALRDVQYDKATWAMVKAYLDSFDKLKLPGAKKVGAHHKIYIISRLIEPLVISKPEVIREALPTVRKIDEQYRNGYIAFAKLPPQVLAACKMPANVPRTPEMIKRNLEARAQKALLEQPTKTTNEGVGSIEKTYVCLMAFAGDPAEDAKLVKWIETNESKKNHIWMLGLETLNTETASPDMTKERAKALLPLMRQMVEDNAKQAVLQMRGVRLKPAEYEYVCRWYKAAYLPEMFPDEGSKAFSWRWEHTAYKLLTSVKWMDLAANGVRDAKGVLDPTKSAMVVRNPSKSDPKTFANDKEFWDTNKTKKETPPQGYDGPPP
jgi:hypothetical protein